MTALVVAQTVLIDMSKRLVVLPRVCSWFLADFTPSNRKSGTTAVPVDCLRCIAHYIRSEDSSKLIELLLMGNTPTIKFKEFKMKAKPLVVGDSDF